MKKVISLFLIIVSVCFLVFGCEKKPKLYSGNVVIYSTLENDKLEKLKEEFEKEYLGIQLDYHSTTIDRMNNKLSAEYRSQQFNADVVYGGTPLDFEMYINNKYLQPYKSKNSSKISKDLKEENNYYTGASIITLGFGNNKSLFNEEEKTPESWNDLLKGEFTDLVVCTEHSNASIIKYFIACMMQNESYGEEYFKKLKDNGIKFVKGANATVEDIIDGKYKTGICIDYVAFSNVDEENNFSFNYPSKDNVILPTPIGLLNNCDNPENGKYLIDFILSKKGQEILAETGLSPARKDIKIKDTKNIINNCMKVDAKNLLANYDKYLEEFDFIFK